MITHLSFRTYIQKVKFLINTITSEITHPEHGHILPCDIEEDGCDALGPNAEAFTWNSHEICSLTPTVTLMTQHTKWKQRYFLLHESRSASINKTTNEGKEHVPNFQIETLAQPEHKCTGPPKHIEENIRQVHATNHLSLFVEFHHGGWNMQRGEITNEPRMQYLNKFYETNTPQYTDGYYAKFDKVITWTYELIVRSLEEQQDVWLAECANILKNRNNDLQIKPKIQNEHIWYQFPLTMESEKIYVKVLQSDGLLGKDYVFKTSNLKDDRTNEEKAKNIQVLQHLNYELQMNYIIYKSAEIVKLQQHPIIEQMCEQKRVLTLSVLQYARLNPANASYMLTGNKSMFVDTDGALLYLYGCSRTQSPLYINEDICYDKIPIFYKGKSNSLTQSHEKL